MVTRVFVKRARTKGATKDRWPERQKGPKDARVLIELPTTTPKIGGNSAGQFCEDDAEVLKFIQKKDARRLWKDLGHGVASGEFVDYEGAPVFEGVSFKFYQNILMDDVINLVFDFDDCAPNQQTAQIQQQKIIDWFKLTVMEKLKLSATEADKLIAISHCTRPDPKSIQARAEAQEHIEVCDAHGPLGTTEWNTVEIYEQSQAKLEMDMPWKVSLHVIVNGYVCLFKDQKLYFQALDWFKDAPPALNGKYVVDLSIYENVGCGT